MQTKHLSFSNKVLTEKQPYIVQSVALDSRVVSSILTEGLGVAFFATGLGWVLENL